MNLGLQIARDVAWALSEVHSKDIIHRDLKSENILFEMDESERCAVVKLCDFDKAVPLRSWLHTCCIVNSDCELLLLHIVVNPCYIFVYSDCELLLLQQMSFTEI